MGAASSGRRAGDALHPHHGRSHSQNASFSSGPTSWLRDSSFPCTRPRSLLRPLILVTGGYAQLVSAIFGADVQRAFVTREELSLLLEASEGQGQGPEAEITESEREMITNLLEMSGATVAAVMLPLSEITAIPQETSAAEAVREVADKQHSRMPVYDGRVDNIVGVLHVFDLLQVGAHEREAPIKELAQARPLRARVVPCDRFAGRAAGVGQAPWRLWWTSTVEPSES